MSIFKSIFPGKRRRDGNKLVNNGDYKTYYDDYRTYGIGKRDAKMLAALNVLFNGLTSARNGAIGMMGINDPKALDNELKPAYYKNKNDTQIGMQMLNSKYARKVFGKYGVLAIKSDLMNLIGPGNRSDNSLYASKPETLDMSWIDSDPETLAVSLNRYHALYQGLSPESKEIYLSIDTDGIPGISLKEWNRHWKIQGYDLDKVPGMLTYDGMRGLGVLDSEMGHGKFGWVNKPFLEIGEFDYSKWNLYVDESDNWKNDVDYKLAYQNMFGLDYDVLKLIYNIYNNNPNLDDDIGLSLSVTKDYNSIKSAINNNLNNIHWLNGRYEFVNPQPVKQMKGGKLNQIRKAAFGMLFEDNDTIPEDDIIRGNGKEYNPLDYELEEVEKAYPERVPEELDLGVDWKTVLGVGAGVLGTGVGAWKAGTNMYANNKSKKILTALRRTNAPADLRIQVLEEALEGTSGVTRKAYEKAIKELRVPAMVAKLTTPVEENESVVLTPHQIDYAKLTPLAKLRLEQLKAQYPNFYVDGMWSNAFQRALFALMQNEPTEEGLDLYSVMLDQVASENRFAEANKPQEVLSKIVIDGAPVAETDPVVVVDDLQPAVVRKPYVTPSIKRPEVPTIVPLEEFLTMVLKMHGTNPLVLPQKSFLENVMPEGRVSLPTPSKKHYITPSTGKPSESSIAILGNVSKKIKKGAKKLAKKGKK